MRERREVEGERKGEKPQPAASRPHAQGGGRTKANPGKCPDGNQRAAFGVRTLLPPTEPHGPGHKGFVGLLLFYSTYEPRNKVPSRKLS